MHLMIDLETLSTEQNAIILNIGAIGFDPFSSNVYTQHSFYARIDLESQPTRHESEQTLKWWMKQHKDSQEEAFGEDNRIPLNIALGEVSKLVRKSSKVWSQGVGFDIPILENAYKENQVRYGHRVLDLIFLFWKMLIRIMAIHIRGHFGIY